MKNLLLSERAVIEIEALRDRGEDGMYNFRSVELYKSITRVLSVLEQDGNRYIDELLPVLHCLNYWHRRLEQLAMTED